MPDWDADSPRLRQNLIQLLRRLRDEASKRTPPTHKSARHWHRDALLGLTAPDPAAVGCFRGEPGLEDVEVIIGSHFGVRALDVAEALGAFDVRLQLEVGRLDIRIPVGEVPDDGQLAAVLDLCAWAHAEWVRIHPFANGNGRTARLWANSLAMRYGLPPFVRLRPRPDQGYAAAGEAAMDGHWTPTTTLFCQMLDAHLRNGG